MSDLDFFDKMKLEELLGMSSGYVLNFTNRNFEEFVATSTGKIIYDSKYGYFGGSKANRLRAFWENESNYTVGKLISDLLKYYGQLYLDSSQEDLYKDCKRIAERLLQNAPVQEIEAITPNLEGRDFEVLAKLVREAIEKNEPESGLDRLHTFVIKYIRVLCSKHGISVARAKPLHGLFGEYVKTLKKKGVIESEMTEKILKSSIHIMEAFNRVRNEQSLAHDNPILNYNESLLIFNHIASAIRFIGVLEGDRGVLFQKEDSLVETDDDIPF